MVETYVFADNEAGLISAFKTTLSLRRAGFKTRLIARRIANTVCQVLEATPAPRPNRKVRGCDIR